MTNEYKFFYEFFDGQIVKPESEKFKTFKVLLFSIFLTAGIFAVIMKYSQIIPLFVLAAGMLWNVYLGLSKKISGAFSVIVAFLYFYIACQFSLYAHCLIYIGCYIPLQNIANAKDYSEGDFVQIRKYITDANKIILTISFLASAMILILFNFAVGANFVYLDAISAAFLVFAALLRNERYSEYYFFRFVGLVLSLALWIMVAIEFGTGNSLAIIFMYFSYIIYDFISLIYQRKTYINQYMQKQQEARKIDDKNRVKQKIEIYEKMQKSK